MTFTNIIPDMNDGTVRVDRCYLCGEHQNIFCVRLPGSGSSPKWSLNESDLREMIVLIDSL